MNILFFDKELDYICSLREIMIGIKCRQLAPWRYPMPTWFISLLLGLSVLVVGLVIVAVFKRFRGDPVPYDSLLDGDDDTMHGMTTHMPDEVKHGV